MFGGTFDPPHFGHLISAEVLAEKLSLSRVIFIPSGRPPHKVHKQISPVECRVDMLRLAIRGNDLFGIDECEIGKLGPCYSIETVGYFRQTYPQAKLYWLIGADSLAELPLWYQFDKLIEKVEIISSCRGGFGTDKVLSELEGQVTRGQYDKLAKNLVKTPMIEISASNIRERVREGKSIRYMLPEAVAEYIAEKGLYICK